MAPPTALPGHGLLSLLQEPPAFSFSGTGGIYFLCHFGGCLPCQRLFCRVQTDKKVVSRLFGGGREDCLVRERRALCSQQPHAALPLRPPLQRDTGWGQGRVTPTPLHPGCFSGTSVHGATLVTRDCVAVPGLGSVSPGIWEMRLMNVQSNSSITHLRALLRQCPETEPFLQDMWGGKKGQEPSSGCGDGAVVIWQPPCSRMCLWSSGRRELALLGAHEEETRRFTNSTNSFPRTCPCRQRETAP